MYHVFLSFQCVYGRSDQKDENGDREDGREIKEEGRETKFPGHLHADNLVLCVESEEDLRAIVGSFVEVCRRRGLKVNAGSSNVMALNGEGLLKFEISVGNI